MIPSEFRNNLLVSVDLPTLAQTKCFLKILSGQVYLFSESRLFIYVPKNHKFYQLFPYLPELFVDIKEVHKR